ncbi:MAG TPA: hypothetical protein VHO47_00130 [Candidatus Babeliales bacterium]|nr:hypothetical protein [Candidatus Babeliales bacterium]
MKKLFILFLLAYLVNINGMDYRGSFHEKTAHEKRSSYNAKFELTESSNDLFVKVLCTPKEKKVKRPSDKFKKLCKDYMFYQLITHPDLRRVGDFELTRMYTTLDLSNRGIDNVKEFLKKAVLAFRLSTGKKPNKKILGDDFSVHFIDLSNNNLKALPKGFKELAQCAKRISLSNNNFAEVPAELEFCTGLKYLDVSGNKEIKILPDWTTKIEIEADKRLKSNKK